MLNCDSRDRGAFSALFKMHTGKIKQKQVHRVEWGSQNDEGIERDDDFASSYALVIVDVLPFSLQSELRGREGHMVGVKTTCGNVFVNNAFYFSFYPTAPASTFRIVEPMAIEEFWSVTVLRLLLHLLLG